MENNLLEKEKSTRENRIWVRIAAACNEKCLFCLDADAQNGKLIEDEKIRKDMMIWFKTGMYNRIIISGGEASIHPKFPEYIKYAKELWYNRIQTVTNGNRYADPNFLDWVIQAGLQEITFSIHGHTKEIHDYLTATPGSFDKALRAIITIRKKYPQIILNIDIVVNKKNVRFLPKIVKLFMKLGIFEFDILQIIPFGRGFSEYKDVLFYNIEDELASLHETWKLSRYPGMYMWTNRFPVEAFEWYEDLIQDPRKIKSETMGEAYMMFDDFIRSQGIKKPICFGDQCDVCFLKQYCHGYLSSRKKEVISWEVYTISGQDNIPSSAEYVRIEGEEFPSEIYKKYGRTQENFLEYIHSLALPSWTKFLNLPRCIREDHNDEWLYESYKDDEVQDDGVAHYTNRYIKNHYRIKSLRCHSCKYVDSCQWIHINFIRSYGFSLLKPLK